MPYYDFKCEEHGILEIIVNIKDIEDINKCPICGKPLKRVYSIPFLMGDLPTLNKKSSISYN